MSTGQPERLTASPRTKMSTTHRACTALVVVAAALCVSASAALEPNQVLVVANAASADSLALAKLYVQQRGIPEQNYLEVRTATGMDVARAAYDSEIAGPIRKALEDRNLKERVRCLCLMYGVPVRVGAPAAPAAPTPTSRPQPSSQPGAAPVPGGTAGVLAERYHYRLAVVHKLLSTIARDFPAPRTDDLAPMGKLFATPMSEPTRPLLSVDKLRDDTRRLLGAAQTAVDLLDDPAKKTIASRQLMAVTLELGGLQGLIDYIRDNQPAGAPGREELEKRLRSAQGELALLRQQRPEAQGEVLALVGKVSGLLTAMDMAGAGGSGTPGERSSSGPGAAPPAAGLQQRDSSRGLPQPPRDGIEHKAEAAVDSELALLWWDNHELEGWVSNPLNWRLRRAAGAAKTPPVLMTARLDGPTPTDVMKVIKTSAAVEKHALAGTFYIDSGGPDRVAAPARQAYDAKLRATYDFVRRHTDLKAVLDERPALLAKDSCPNAALYVGWYSLQHYVPAFSWEPGAVGWHVASWEAVHLRDPNSQEWCPKMIQNGVAATLGAVGEPLLHHFPNPEEFFPLLLSGKLTLAECYWATIPAASWQMILLGDPLYTPFKAKSPIK
jgi:uncharacterized protein (TIGR03790 family)